MVVKNPTNDELYLMFKGVEYRIEPQGQLFGVPEDAAYYWKRHIHQFVKVEKEPEYTGNVKETLSEEQAEEPAEADHDTVVSTDYASMKRDELDAVAEAKGLDPSEYSKKADLVEALNEQ